MYFFDFLLFFISSIGHSAFCHLDEDVEGAFRGVPAAQHPMAQFLFPQHLRAAENMVRGYRKVDSDSPHPDRCDACAPPAPL